MFCRIRRQGNSEFWRVLSGRSKAVPVRVDMGPSCSSLAARQTDALLAAAAREKELHVREKEKDLLLAVAAREKELLAREKEKDALLAAVREKELLLLLATKDKEQLQEKLAGLQDAATRTRMVQLLRSAQKTGQHPGRADGGEHQYLLPTSPTRATMLLPSPSSLFGAVPLSPSSSPAKLRPAVEQDGTVVQNTQQHHDNELFARDAPNMELQQ